MSQAGIVRPQIRRHFAGVVALLLLTSLRVLPQENTGALDVYVRRLNTQDGVADAAITLQGPYPPVTPGMLASLYKPNPALTPAMKEQVDALIASAPLTVTAEVVANVALRLESQLLGLPAPTPPPAASTGPAAPPPQVGGLTDSSGHAIFPKLAAGRYQIRAQREGYFAAPPPGSAALTVLPTVTNSTVTIDAAQPTLTVDVIMLRGATVSGRVRDPNGQPLSGVQVSAHSIAYQNNREILNTINTKQTDDRGEFRLFWLPPGDFYIGVTPRPATNNPTVQDTYSRTYFPGTANLRAAARVRVSEGGEATGIDIGVRSDATGKISGRVVTSITGPNGQPAQATTFFLMPREGDTFADFTTMNFQNLAANRANGQFEIRGVLPGSYDLITNIANATNGPAIGRVRVDVAGGSVDDVIIPVKMGVEVKALLKLDTGAVPFTMAAPPPGRGGIQTVVTSNGVTTVISESPLAAGPASTTPVPTPTYRVQLRSLEVYPSPFDSAAQQFTFDPSGVFVFPNVPECRYYAAVNPLAPNWYLADVRVGDKSVFSDGFEVGTFSGSLEVTVKSRGAKATGVVRDAAQKPMPSARVVLIPSSTQRQNLVLYKSTVADGKGNFTIMGIAPGEYKLFAWESVLTSAWMNAEFMKPYEGFGKTIDVLEGATVTSDLKIIPSL